MKSELERTVQRETQHSTAGVLLNISQDGQYFTGISIRNRLALPLPNGSHFTAFERETSYREYATYSILIDGISKKSNY